MKQYTIWKRIPFDSPRKIYEVSNTGQIRSISKKTGTKRLLQQQTMYDGYKTVSIDNKTIGVHILVMLTFKGPKTHSRIEVCHNDNNRANNYLSNLRYDTRSGNQQDRIKHNTHSRGTKHGRNKLSEIDIKSILNELNSNSSYDVAKKYNIGQSTVMGIKRGHSWSWLTGIEKCSCKKCKLKYKHSTK